MDTPATANSHRSCPVRPSNALRIQPPTIIPPYIPSSRARGRPQSSTQLDSGPSARFQNRSSSGGRIHNGTGARDQRTLSQGRTFAAGTVKSAYAQATYPDMRGGVRLSMAEFVVADRQVRQRLESQTANDSEMPDMPAPAPAPPPAPAPAPVPQPQPTPAPPLPLPPALNLLLGPVPQCDFGHAARPTAPVLRLAARSLGVCISEADIDDPST